MNITVALALASWIAAAIYTGLFAYGYSVERKANGEKWTELRGIMVGTYIGMMVVLLVGGYTGLAYGLSAADMNMLRQWFM